MTPLRETAEETLRLDAEATPTGQQGPGYTFHQRYLACAADMLFIARTRTAAPRMARALLAILPAIERLREAHASGWQVVHDGKPRREDIAIDELLAAADAASKEQP